MKLNFINSALREKAKSRSLDFARDDNRALGDQQQVQGWLGRIHITGPARKRNTTVLGEQEVVIQMALTAEPEMFNLNVAPIPLHCADDPTTAKIMKLFTALRIHTL
jgi:hypothetical protein